MQTADDVATTQLPLTDGAHEVSAIVELERLRRRVEVVIGRTQHPATLCFLVDHLAAQLDRRLLLLHPEALLDAMPRAARAYVREPVTIRTRRR